MALSFIETGVTDRIRNSKRKGKVTLIEWGGLASYFTNKLKADTDKLIRETQWAKERDANNPIETRMMFGNANVPMGTNKTNDLVKSVVCKDEAQGKKYLNEFIVGLDNDIDVQRVVAQFMIGRKGFDASTIPTTLLGEC